MQAFGRWLLSLWGSRVAIAVFAGLFVAFVSHAVTQPDRLPPLARIGLATIGVADLAPPPPLPLPDQVARQLSPETRAEIRAQITAEANKSAPTLAARATTYFEDNPRITVWVNRSAAALSFLGMFGAIALYAGTIRKGRARSGGALAPSRTRPAAHVTAATSP